MVLQIGVDDADGPAGHLIGLLQQLLMIGFEFQQVLVQVAQDLLFRGVVVEGLS